MDKINKLPENAVSAALEANKVYVGITEKISVRMNYILNFCVGKVGGKVSWWDWRNGGDGDDSAPGDFMHSYSSTALDINGEWTNGDRMIFIDKDGGEWGIEYGEFPIRWLFEDFEDEYTNGLKLYKKKLEEQSLKAKGRRIRNSQKKKELVASAAMKLTKEERKALGI